MVSFSLFPLPLFPPTSDVSRNKYQAPLCDRKRYNNAGFLMAFICLALIIKFCDRAKDTQSDKDQEF